MNNFTTIKKQAETTGLKESTIRNLIKKRILTKNKIPDLNRILINQEEFNAIIKPESEIKIDVQININDFLIS